MGAAENPGPVKPPTPFPSRYTGDMLLDGHWADQQRETLLGRPQLLGNTEELIGPIGPTTQPLKSRLKTKTIGAEKKIPISY